MNYGNGISMPRVFFADDFLWPPERIHINMVEKTGERLIFFTPLKADFLLFKKKIKKFSIITTFLIEFPCKAYFGMYSNDCSI